MGFEILGPLAAHRDGNSLPLGGPKQRKLLGVLLVHANEVVSRDQLIDALWGERPPASAPESLDVYVYRLRKLLGHDRLRRRSGGYALVVDSDELDATRFDALRADAARSVQSGDVDGAARQLAEALALWHGPALAEFAYEPFAQGEIARLEEARLSTTEDWIEAQLELGGGPELVPELQRLAAEHPLRERLVGQLMLSLYRAGRQADALATFRDARRRLCDELGLEPVQELRDLEQRILEQDPSLFAARSRPTPADEPAPGPRRLGRRAIALVAALAVAFVSLILLSAGSSRPAAAGLRSENGVVAVSPGSDRPVAVTALTGAPGAVSEGDGSIWVAEPGAGEVARVDPGSGAVTQEIAVGSEPGSIVTGGGAIWVAGAISASVTRIDPTTENVTQTISLPGANPTAIAYGDGVLWVADSVGHQLFEIDPASGSLLRTVPLDLQPSALAVVAGRLWVAGYADAMVEERSAGSGRLITRVRVGDGPASLTFADGSLWVANSLDATVSRIDPVTAAVTATTPVGSGPTAVAAAGGSIWVANQYSDTVSRIDPHGGRVIAAVSVGGQPTSLGTAGRRLWVGIAASDSSHRGGTLVIVTPGPLTSGDPQPSIDPAFYNISNNPQFIGLAYDSLVTFQHSAGATGLRLVPDLAIALPEVSGKGSVYVFRIRPGIRYSDGRVVQATDFRRGIERLFRVGSPATSVFSGIVGAVQCVRHPAGCQLSRGIVTDDAARTVVFHLTSPDPNFLAKLTEEGFSAPVPPGTPDHEADGGTVPGTGPYEIARAGPNEIRFVRNPYFREWSHAAQPAGYPDAIVWRAVATPQAGVDAIEQGRADWLWGQIPPSDFRRLELQDPAQLHSNPLFSVEFAPLNTHAAPFDRLSVRRALNYAIDRATIARLYGGPFFATPTCQAISPGLPGYRRYCPYTVHPDASGTWHGADMTLARELVARSGTRGDVINLWGSPDEGFIPPATPAYFARVLRALGYRVRLHLVALASITPAMWRRFQISVIGDWTANYPDPSSYVPQFFACRGGNSNGYYCNPALDREMRQADQLELTNPPRARLMWATVDRQLTDAAVWVPTVTMRDVELTSRRLGNYQYGTVWGFLADQSWVR